MLGTICAQDSGLTGGWGGCVWGGGVWGCGGVWVCCGWGGGVGWFVG